MRARLKLTRKMTNRYKCGPDSNWTNMTRKWSIDIGAAPTQTQTDKTRIWSSGSKPKDNSDNDASKLGRRGYAPVWQLRINRQLSQMIPKPMKGPTIWRTEGMPQYVTVNKLSCEMTQSYCTLKYAQSSCNENVQPRIGNAKLDHVSWHNADKTKQTYE